MRWRSNGVPDKLGGFGSLLSRVLRRSRSLARPTCPG